MNPKVPNKLASIFVTGGLATVLISFFYGGGFINALYSMGEIKVPDTASSYYTVVNSARFLVVVTGVITLVGAILQGFGHMIRNVLQHLVTSVNFCYMFCNGAARREIGKWNSLFVSLASDALREARVSLGKGPDSQGEEKKQPLQSETEEKEQPLQSETEEKDLALGGIPEFAGIYDLEDDTAAPFSDTVHPIVPRQSVSIFFRFSDGQHLSWVLEHYATYYLTTDILASLLVTGLAIPSVQGCWPFAPTALDNAGLIENLWSEVAWYASLLLILYSLAVVSVHRYLYTYIAVIRYCCAVMSHRNPNFPKPSS